jgi:hypothetical protein
MLSCANIYKNNDFMLAKIIIPNFGKLLIVNNLKDPYSAFAGCSAVLFGARGKIVILRAT